MGEVPADTPVFPSLGENVCLEFLNSEWGDFRGRFRADYLLNPAWLQAFLKRWDLQVTDPPTPATVAVLQELRTHMRHIIEALPASDPSPDDLDMLNAILLRASSKRRLVWRDQKYEWEEVVPSRDWQWVIGEIAAAFANLLVGCDHRRLKICANPYCRSYFYDKSKSRTQHWCFSKCANLWRTRRFRARRKKEGDSF